ncbi:hypothetical protein B0J13DRAFT_634362 [Dactylonectria estremocensis]|uniref:Uncharacterized protein n=1 Tax=Dactylonectria estremocensis TaxID=1079267 RepID=A0A9P9JF12_9HYPO|nr:hypothetical protein B0J13DRAFT_634362 [Dactylonectria estremocensis]
MAATYKQFLAAPSSSLLADTASLHYVTTTKSFSGSTEIIKHINGLQKQISKKKEDILNLVDGGNAVVLEIDTGLSFLTGGGPYLPGLDDNFLTTHAAYLSITHFVTFDEAGKISQIRLQWDQGSLLKQVDVIGKSGRNWPIIDSREQIAFIQACIKSAGTMTPVAPSHNETINRTRGNSNNAFRDPHASLQLFGSREEIEAPFPEPVMTPYGGTRPRQRSFTEILGDEPVDGSPSANRHQSMSPSKGGQGKNFQPSRIFDGQQHIEEVEEPKTKANRVIRPNPAKYDHFDFADGTDPQDAPTAGQSFDDRPKSKHDSQWSFNDFVTPQKVKPSRLLRTQDIRHWDTDKDTVEETPAQQATRPRRDADTHFELQDDGERVPHPPRPGAKPKGYTHNEGLGLYKNQLFDKEDPDSASDRALGNITNLKDRGKTFDHHFNITDDSPAHSHTAQPVPEGRKKAVQMMDANWSSYEQSPAPKKENNDAKRTNDGINIAGDGMGGRKGSNRDWLYGETAETQPIPTRKPNAGPAIDGPKNAKIHIAGDGMGGRRGVNRDYLEGEFDEAVQPTNAIPSRKPGHGAAPTETQHTRIQIAGDGMGGRRGVNRDYLEGEFDEAAQPTNAIPSRKPGASAGATENKNARIHIAGDGMGGKRGVDRDYLEADGDEEPSKSVPTRKPGASAATTENQNTRIHIAGDGMGGKKGTNRDWLYGDLGEDAQAAPSVSAPTRKQGANTAAKKDFWDF